MNVLVACEESQEVCKAFRSRGHEAFSCDILECSGGHPEWHIHESCMPILGGGIRFKTADGEVHEIDGTWDLIIAHPPCTYLTVTGNRWFKDECLNAAQARYLDRAEAIEFFLRIAICNAKKLAIENPVGIMSSVYRKPDQIIEPYWFGERARKKTCLWLRNLPPLVPTDMVDCGEISKEGLSMGAGAYHAVDDTGKIIAWNDPMTAIIRSRTYPGIAKAMAEQWG